MSRFWKFSPPTFRFPSVRLPSSTFCTSLAHSHVLYVSTNSTLRSISARSFSTLPANIHSSRRSGRARGSQRLLSSNELPTRIHFLPSMNHVSKMTVCFTSHSMEVEIQNAKSDSFA
ncbi:hypothetical protein L218DRAFT_229575 [Marasmius fiardii PR-910]|nr:hypothetical protein L218DRAFT_229575 [Marasmius fiardii PR-910]